MRELPWNSEIGLSFENPIAPSQPKWYQVPYMTITHEVDFLRYQGSGHTVGLQWWYITQSSPLLAWHFNKLTIVSSSFIVAHEGSISLSKDAYHGMKVAVKRANLIPPLETCNQTYNYTFHHANRVKSYYPQAPLLTHQQAPRCRTSLPLKMLFHAHEPIQESTASIIEVVGENLALKTL